MNNSRVKYLKWEIVIICKNNNKNTPTAQNMFNFPKYLMIQIKDNFLVDMIVKRNPLKL